MTGSAADLERRILDRIDPERIALLTTELVRAGGENPGGTERRTVETLREALEDLGASVELDRVAPDRPNLVARIGGPGPGILFLGHSDVVPAGTGWTGDPFESRRDGGDLIGRGTTDMKGGLAAVVAAMAAVSAEAPEIPMTLVCTVDEEADATGALRYIARPAREEYAVCVVAEPTGLVTITACRGAANLRIDLRGVSAHAGRPEDGASAILAARDVIAAVEEDDARLARDPHPVLGRASWSVGTVSGGHGTSIVADRCTLTLDRRLLPDDDPDGILDRMIADIRGRLDRRPDGDRLRVSGTVEMAMPGFLTDPGSATVRTACRAVRDAGGAGDRGVWTAACEGGFLQRHHDVPTVVLGPGDITGQAHQPDERVPVADLATAARAYALLALRIPSAVDEDRLTEGARP